MNITQLPAQRIIVNLEKRGIWRLLLNEYHVLVMAQNDPQLYDPARMRQSGSTSTDTLERVIEK